MRFSASVLLATVAVSFSFPKYAQADQADACVSAAETGQALRDAGHLLDARTRFRECVNTSCPGIVRKDCDAWLRETEDFLPSILIRVRRPNGEEVIPTKLTLDGREVSPGNGRATDVDPGPHQVLATLSNGSNIATTFVSREREKGRVVDVVVSEAPAPEARPVRASAIVATGMGGVALASFAFFGIRGLTKYSDLQTDCRPGCASDDVSAARRDLVIADVSLGLAVIAAGAAVYLFLAPPSQTSARAQDVGVIRF